MFQSLILTTTLAVLAARPAYTQEGLPVAPPEEVGLSSEKLEEVGRLMRQRIDGQEIAGGVVMIARRGKVAFFEAYGQLDRETGTPMERDTIFRLYSMSKAITTAAAMMLVDEGAIALDDRVSKYLPGLAGWKVKTPDGLVEPNRPIIIKDLMLHTTGMDELSVYPEADLWKLARPEDLVNALTTVPLARHPGERWEYSRSLNLLGLVIEVVSGQSLADFLQERLFEPLGMVDTAFFVPEEKQGRFAVFYLRTRRDEEHFLLSPPAEDAMDVAVTRHLTPPRVAMGGTGLVGTAEDYMRFLLMIANGGEWDGRRYLSRESVRMMTTNQLPEGIWPIWTVEERHGVGFGCGFNVIMTEDSWEQGSQIDEFGWAGAACTHCWVSPRDDDLIVVTMEQIWPTNRETRFRLRPVIYQAIQ